VPGERERRAWVRMQDFADRLDHNWKRIAESRKDD
jgi:hypothetical protein